MNRRDALKTLAAGALALPWAALVIPDGGLMSSRIVQGATMLDRATLQAMLDVGGTVELPPGVHTIDYTTAGDALRITKPTRLIGAGRGITVLQFGPDAPTFAYRGIRIEPGMSLTIEHLTLAGPANATTAVETHGVQHGGTSGDLRLRSVDITGKFTIAIEGGWGQYLIDAEDCDISAYRQVLNHGQGNGQKKQFHARGCHFHLAPDTPISSQWHILYPNPAVSLDISHCRFSGPVGGYAIHHYGSSTDAPDYVRITDCRFEQTGLGILTTPNGYTQIRGCTFRGPVSGVCPRGDVDVIDCEFNGLTVAVGGGIGPVRRVNVIDCRMNSCVSGWEAVTGDATSVNQIINCTFLNGAQSIENQRNDGEVIVRDCKFIAASAYRAALVGKGKLFFDNCQFTNYTGIVIQLVLGTISELEMTRSKFKGCTGQIVNMAGNVNCAVRLG